MEQSAKSNILLETSLPGVELLGRGKVRDIYGLDDRLLIVATDRISAFDYILATGIPESICRKISLVPGLLYNRLVLLLL